MGSIRFLCLILCLACSCARPTKRQTIAKISQDLQKFSLSQKSSIKIDKLGEQIEQLALLQKIPPTLSSLWSSTLTKAIAVYQFLYFLKPNIKRWQKLQGFYPHFDQHQSDFKNKYSFHTLRKILAYVKLKSQQAPELLEQVVALLNEPKYYGDFFRKQF